MAKLWRIGFPCFSNLRDTPFYGQPNLWPLKHREMMEPARLWPRKKLTKPEMVFLVSRRFSFFSRDGDGRLSFLAWTIRSFLRFMESVRGLGWLRVGGPQRLGRVWRGSHHPFQWSSWEEFSGIFSMSLDMAFPFRSGTWGIPLDWGHVVLPYIHYQKWVVKNSTISKWEVHDRIYHSNFKIIFRWSCNLSEKEYAN